MRLMITAGGSREPIDSVRYVGNASTGRTGVRIAEEAVRRFHTVYLLSGLGSLTPSAWAVSTGLLVQRPYGTASDLLMKCQELCLRHRFDAVVAAAAVADYAPVPESGKISSSLSQLLVRMEPTAKVIDQLRVLCPDATLVAFKLEAGVNDLELRARARATMTRTGADFAVANLVPGMGLEEHPSVVMDAGGREWLIENRTKLAGTLLHLLEERIGQ